MAAIGVLRFVVRSLYALSRRAIPLDRRACPAEGNPRRSRGIDRLPVERAEVVVLLLLDDRRTGVAGVAGSRPDPGAPRLQVGSEEEPMERHTQNACRLLDPCALDRRCKHRIDNRRMA